MKTKTLQYITQAGMIPVFYNDDTNILSKVVKACYDGGLRLFEFTNRGDKAVQNFCFLKELIKTKYPDMLLGIGSIINKKQAKVFIKHGADFVVSPVLNKGVAKICKKHNLMWIPGCATPTEIAKADVLGADIIKVFPGNVLGTDFVKAVLGPMRWLKLMPTGGVEPTEENLKAWFDAGVVCVGMGSQLINKSAIEQPEKLSNKIKETISIIINFKNNDK